ncbi:MAG: nucleoside/nucleotide kinase family protein [Candidatus Melainabacteria bacterium]|nr:nucleoside/nucleotide kinase family protein [Candidatus Melainabacteria bacterium]
MNRSDVAAPETVDRYVKVLLSAKAAKKNRYLLGLAGSPASGKSTFSAQLVDGVNRELNKEVAVVVPMDGYHFSNEVLDEKGLRPLKGIPATFDAQGFVDLIKRLKEETDRSVFAPLFDRSIEASIENGIEIAPHHEIIVSEGNYLLLDEKPWNELRNLFDEIWFIDSTIEKLMPRLLARHKECGRNTEETKTKIDSTDLPNAILIDRTKSRAHRVIDI